jgi:hypothetical protein
MRRRAFFLRLGVSGAAFVAGAAAVAAFAAPNSFATQSLPHKTTSYYVATTSTETAYNQGKAQGAADAAVYPYENSEVVLDFGGQNPDNTGTKFTINDGSGATYAQIRAYAENFAKGWYAGATQNRDVYSVLTLAIGTNNSYYQVSATGGATWASSAVKPVVTWLANNGYGYQVTAVGANDIEPGYHEPSGTIAWTNGFAGYGIEYLDYGGADGCSWSSYQDAGCNHGWTQADVYKVAWGGSAYAFVLPEIYYDPSCPVLGHTAQQWTLISRYGWYYGNLGKIWFDGPLTQYFGSGSGCTSGQAWDVFWADLNTNTSLPLGPDGLQSTQSTFEYRTDI